MTSQRRSWLRVVALVWALSVLASPSMARDPSRAVDLGAPRALVEQTLGVASRQWVESTCRSHRIELRRRGGLWLKLVYGADDRLRAAGVFRLALPPKVPGSALRRVDLRWPGLVPGAGARSSYPTPQSWRPVMTTNGAKQWVWIEESHAPADPPGRSRYLGGVVVDDASDFAGGVNFPYDVAEAVTATGPLDADWAEGEMMKPLVAWRRRTPPNAYIETLDADRPSPADCGLLTLAQPKYTDFGR